MPIPWPKQDRSQLILVGIVLCVLVLMVFPVPTWVMDLCLSASIALSVTLLLMALHISEPLQFATFPTFLLLATLFRLGLNIATTRLILLQADAGAVIDAFGRFVAGGNLLVGGVVFLVITVVQFVVIAKGSERVAEVAARFTLDAMPGRQMSIDAELRAGHITHETARLQRQALTRESQLYGAMDGAMKFVKGDAVAGLAITFINLVGGLAVGTFQMGMSASSAVETYSVLTIGDGLVSQIPALLVSVSAGFVITRVSSEEGRGLAQEMGGQILKNPRVLSLSGLLLLVFALLPGLPFLPFFLLGGTFLAWGIFLRRRLGAAAAVSRFPPGGGESPADAARSLAGWSERPLVLAVGSGLGFLQEGAPGRAFSEGMGRLRMKVWWNTGLLLPEPALVVQEGLPPDGYQWRIWEMPVGEGRVRRGMILREGAPGEGEGALAAWSLPGDWVWTDSVGAGENGLQDWEMPLHHLERVMHRHAHELMTLDAAQVLVHALRRTQPALVEECMPHPVSLSLLAEVLQRLLEEQVTIRPLGRILRSLFRHAPQEADPAVLAENVRLDIRREMLAAWGAEGVLPVFLVSPAVEDDVRLAVKRNETGTWLSLHPETVDEWHRRARELAGPLSGRLVLVSSVDVRRFLRRILEPAVPAVRVLSYPELEGHAGIQPVGEF